MEVLYRRDMLADETGDEKSGTQLIICIERDEYTTDINTLIIPEFVKQRRRDALQITELTLRAIEALEKTSINLSILCEKSEIEGVRD